LGTITKRNQPCEKCGSSDAKQVYEDGTGYCFSCSNYFGNWKGNTIESKLNSSNSFTESLSDVHLYDVRGFKDRGITKKVSQYFDVKVAYNESGELDAHYYPYGLNDIVGYKKRKLPKEFTVLGKLQGLFGQKQAGSGGRSLVITEGELDAMSVAQAWLDKYDKIFPIASLPSASQTKVLLEQREWIRSFESVVLWFDMDDAGKDATEKAARIIGYDKVKVVKNVKVKDASDLYRAEGANSIVNTILNAQPWSPVGIVNSSDTWELYKQELEGEYIPWPNFAKELNDKVYGRRLGSITVLCSGTGMGKSSFLKEDQYHLLMNTQDKIGICSLEESVSETIAGLLALHLNKRIQLPDVEVTEAEERKAWEETMGQNRIMLLDHQGSMADDSLIDKMEFMALSGCKYIYLDHITIAVSESSGTDVNTATDKIMSDLLKLVKRQNIWIGVVSHLRKTSNNQKSFEEGAIPSDDDLKGSGSLKQIAAQIIAISRNKTEEDNTKRNTSRLWVLKDRFSGRTGPMGHYRFIESTGRLQHAESIEDDFDI
jgi:twinkle protein